LIFTETRLAGAFVIDLERKEDERGFFARTFCEREFSSHGLESRFVQCNLSYNHRAGTLRGMHWQAEPHGESKLVRCTRGAILDVIVDLRRGTPSYLTHLAVRLDEDNRRALLIPPGVAHGFLTLADATEVFYQMDHEHAPEAARGARWDDPAFALRWPAAPAVISERDRCYPDYRP
jgi:dTDP-4-dehydrorhamnose 3,5-epimerase